MIAESDRTRRAPRTALVLGATGGIGGAVVAALGLHGWNVRAMVRDVDKAAAQAAAQAPRRAPHFVAGDAMNGQDVVRAATAGGDVDAIVHAVNPPKYRHWDDLVLPMIDSSIVAARAAGGARIVLPGTVYNHEPSSTPLIDERTPQNATTRKGRIRVALEERLRDAAPEVPEKRFPWWLMRLLSPFGGFPREAAEIEPVWRHPMRLDNTRLLKLIGSEPHTDLDVAVTRTFVDMGCLGRDGVTSGVHPA